MAERQQTRGIRWTTLGVAVVVTAVLLAGFGMYFAVSHTRLQASMQIQALQRDAFELRRSANQRIRESVSDGLAWAVRGFQTGDFSELASSRTIAPWIREVFVWDGLSLRWDGAAAGADTTANLNPRIQAIVTQRLRDCLNDMSVEHGNQIQSSAERVDGQSVVLACQLYLDALNRLLAVAIRLDDSILQSEFLNDHFWRNGRMAVVDRTSRSDDPWLVSISPALDPLAVVPSTTFLAAQRRGVWMRIAAYTAVTTLFVVGLTLMIRKFIVLVQREVTLSRIKSNFVADVSHELKTPLSLIRMFSEMLGDGRVTTEEKRQEYYRIIHRECSRLTNMIENILDFSRIDAGKKQFTMQNVDVGEVVRSTYEAYRADLEQQGFEHVVVIPRSLPAIQADRDAIGQAVLNLISNAIKYSAEEKSLRIELAEDTRRGKHGVMISVTDRGIGIRPADRSHLFDGFFRADDERVRSKRGTGLGLNLVKNIVEAHGGSIDVETRLVKGTTFRIFLPESAAATEPRE